MVAWRIILGIISSYSNPPFISHLGYLEEEKPYLGDLLTMVINHLLTGMILQVGDDPFLFGGGLFSGAFVVSFREAKLNWLMF